MKKLYIYIVFSLLIILLSCREKVTFTDYTLINNTEHNIKLIPIISSFDSIDSILLMKNENIEYHFDYRGKGGPFQLFGYQLLEVVYDDTISIIHGDINIPVKRNLIDITSFNGGIVEEKNYYIIYKYEYEFTEADYQEALDVQ